MIALEQFTYTNQPTYNCAEHLLLQTVYKCIDTNENNCDSLVEQLHNEFLVKIFLENCQDCLRMAALPQGAFTACKVREYKFREHELTISRMKAANERNEAKANNENKKLMEYSPVKYNEKLMNSIWGQYNRYSPHNIKTNEYESKGYYLQQQIAVASHAVAESLAMALRSGKEWCFGEK